jgi:hypothetical protein
LVCCERMSAEGQAAQPQIARKGREGGQHGQVRPFQRSSMLWKTGAGAPAEPVTGECEAGRSEETHTTGRLALRGLLPIGESPAHCSSGRGSLPPLQVQSGGAHRNLVAHSIRCRAARTDVGDGTCPGGPTCCTPGTDWGAPKTHQHPPFSTVVAALPGFKDKGSQPGDQGPQLDRPARVRRVLRETQKRGARVRRRELPPVLPSLIARKDRSRRRPWPVVVVGRGGRKWR